MMITALLTFVLGAVVTASPVRAGDVWEQPRSGVRYLHRTTGDQDIHAAFIDLKWPGVRVVATAPEEARATVSTWAKRRGVQVAVNGDFFNLNPPYAPQCPAVGKGKAWGKATDDAICVQIAATDGKVEIFNDDRLFKPAGWNYAVSGRPPLVNECHARADLTNPERAPRTGVGLTADKSNLIIVVADGRRRSAKGMTTMEIAKLLQEFGACHAINLDGGGSSTMYFSDLGVVNRPSDGQERVVTNHLGVIIPKAPRRRPTAE